MRNLLLASAMALLVVVAWGRDADADPSGISAPDLSPMDQLLQVAQNTGVLQLAQAYDCSNESCKRLRSCAEACYKLLVCGQSIRDRDKDGIPCENLCSRPCP